MTNETKMTRIIFRSRLSLAVILPGYITEAPDVLPIERLRCAKRVLLRNVCTKERFFAATLEIN